MSFVIASLFLIIGLIGMFRPSFFYRSEILTPQQIERNNRIWTRGGLALAGLGATLLILSFLLK